MNYKNISMRSLSEFCDESPKMTLTQILYSVIREKNSGVKNISDLKDITDEEFYTMIEKAKQFENE